MQRRPTTRPSRRERSSGAGLLALWLSASLLAGCGEKDVNLTGMETAGESTAAPAESSGMPSSTTLSASTSTGPGTESGETTGSSSESSTGEPEPIACDTQTPTAVWFINFDGAELIFGGEDAPNDETSNDTMAGPFPPYGDGEKRDEVLAFVRELFAPYNIAIVDERPPGQYSMIMVGPHPALAGLSGVSLLDCGDSWKTNVSFANWSADDGATARVTAVSIAGNIGPALGLEHVTGHSEDVMNFEGPGVLGTFTDVCIEIYGPTAGCSFWHEAFCPEGENTQKSHSELLDRYGPCPE